MILFRFGLALFLGGGMLCACQNQKGKRPAGIGQKRVMHTDRVKKSLPPQNKKAKKKAGRPEPKPKSKQAQQQAPKKYFPRLIDRAHDPLWFYRPGTKTFSVYALSPSASVASAEKENQLKTKQNTVSKQPGPKRAKVPLAFYRFSRKGLLREKKMYQKGKLFRRHIFAYQGQRLYKKQIVTAENEPVKSLTILYKSERPFKKVWTRLKEKDETWVYAYGKDKRLTEKMVYQGRTPRNKVLYSCNWLQNGNIECIFSVYDLRKGQKLVEYGTKHYQGHTGLLIKESRFHAFGVLKYRLRYQRQDAGRLDAIDYLGFNHKKTASWQFSWSKQGLGAIVYKDLNSGTVHKRQFAYAPVAGPGKKRREAKTLELYLSTCKLYKSSESLFRSWLLVEEKAYKYTFY